MEKIVSAWPFLVLIALGAASEFLPRARALRSHHPFGSLGVAFIAGVTLAAAQSANLPALKRRLT